MKSINEKIVDFANTLIGITELEGKNNNFTSTHFKRWLISVGWKEGQPYCSYTAEIVWKYTYQLFNSLMINDIDKLFSANAVKTFENAQDTYPELICTQANGVKPKLGALVVFAKYKDGNPVKTGDWTRGHIGILTENKYNEVFHSFEGNTFDQTNSREGNGNFIKIHSYDEYNNDNGLRLIGFVNPLEV